MAGVTDDTIYGHQPSKVDANEYGTQNYVSKNSNFKSVYGAAQKITTTIKQESDLMEALSIVFIGQEIKQGPENSNGLFLSNINGG